MKSQHTPYELKHIQKDCFGRRDDTNPELTHIYSFFAYSERYNSYFKYIVRAEKYQDCFAIKYYCSRVKHSEFKYSRVLNLFSAPEVKKIMVTVASVIPIILKKYPDASFAFNGSRTYDRNNYVEGMQNTQRYRIYIELVRRLFGENKFYITHYDESSACIFVNRLANADIIVASVRIFNMFSSIFYVTENT